MDKNKRPCKGVFSEADLPVSSTYQKPESRRGLLLYGILAVVLIATWLAYDSYLLSGTAISAGQLSSNHATLTKDCQRCHDSGEGVVSAKCAVCHEKSGSTIDAHSFTSHYIYTSDDKSRIAAATENNAANETECVACHTEHNGQMANITNTPDKRCTPCHEVGSFNTNHPEFEFITKNLTDDTTLLFTHNRHTGFVLKALETSGSRPITEDACLQCHNAELSGAGFNDINFEKHCQTCHLKGKDKSALLPVAEATNPTPGVETLKQIRNRLGPIADWTQNVSSADFKTRSGGKKVQNISVMHADPWIMQNLETIRRKQFAKTELFDLIGVSGTISKQQAKPTLQLAIAKLKQKVSRLKSSPEGAVRDEMQTLDSLITSLQFLAESLAPEQIITLFSSQSLKPRNDMTPETASKLEKLSLELTAGSNGLCLKCHYVSQSAIMAVKQNQLSLLRAKFDHSAHILDRSCIDCHNVIPINAPQNASDSARILQLDKSATLNLPGKDNCIQCHSPAQAAAACITCHNFHPDKSQRSNLRMTAKR